MAENSARKRKRPSAKDARSRMARAVGAEAPMSRAEEPPRETPAAEEKHSESVPGPAGEKLVRLSVDVPRSKHRFLRVLVAQEGVSGMAVIRALIDELQDDERLAERVRERLAKTAR